MQGDTYSPLLHEETVMSLSQRLSAAVGRFKPRSSSRRRHQRRHRLETLEPRSLLSAVPIGDVSAYAFNSNPGARATLYLDFDGHQEAEYGRFDDIDIPAYNLPGSDEATFDLEELSNIETIFRTVAEDYAPFNINVTTVDPSLNGAASSGDAFANGVGLRVAIGGNSFDLDDGFEAGGYAMSGAFQNEHPNVVFAFAYYPDDSTTAFHEKQIANTAAHEAGHAFALSHQVDIDADGILQDYYDPGSGVRATIMGNPASPHARATWAKGPIGIDINGDTIDIGDQPDPADMLIFDEMQILASTSQDHLPEILVEHDFVPNGFGYRYDDHGDSQWTASTMEFADADPLKGIYEAGLRAEGIISQTTDVDYFRFPVTGAEGESIRVYASVKVALPSPNLDAVLELWDAGGTMLDSYDVQDTSLMSLNAEIATEVEPGTYYLAVRSHGDYGDVGQYTLHAREVGGPRIIHAVPHTDHLRVVFNDRIDTDSFTPEDVTITDGTGATIPANQINIVAVDQRERSFDVFFPAYSTVDGVQIAIGPGVRDMYGITMDQDQDLRNGELPRNANPTDDVFRFEDFTSPRVTNVEVEAGKITIHFSEPMNPATIAPAIHLMDPSGNLVPVTGGPTTATSTSFEIPVATFPVGGFDLAIDTDARDRFGNALAEPYEFSIRDDDGPSVKGIGLDETIAIGAKSTKSLAGHDLVVTFDESMDPMSFDTSDVRIHRLNVTPDGRLIRSPVNVAGVDEYTGAGFGGDKGDRNRRFQVSFDNVSWGTYEVVIGPHVTDLFHNEMNQDEDQLNGELGKFGNDDRYVSTFEIRPTVLDKPGSFVDERLATLIDLGEGPIDPRYLKDLEVIDPRTVNPPISMVGDDLFSKSSGKYGGTYDGGKYAQPASLVDRAFAETDKWTLDPMSSPSTKTTAIEFGSMDDEIETLAFSKLSAPLPSTKTVAASNSLQKSYSPLTAGMLGGAFFK